MPLTTSHRRIQLLNTWTTQEWYSSVTHLRQSSPLSNTRRCLTSHLNTIHPVTHRCRWWPDPPLVAGISCHMEIQFLVTMDQRAYIEDTQHRQPLWTILILVGEDDWRPQSYSNLKYVLCRGQRYGPIVFWWLLLIEAIKNRRNEIFYFLSWCEPESV